ncbi:hypothetical protein BH23CHL2_BH23CHL2_07290 [soil metagenome]
MTTIVVRRRGLSQPTVHPTSLRLTLTSFGVERQDGIRRGRLTAPKGWAVESPTPLAWFISPDVAHLNVDAPAMIRLELEYDDSSRRQFSRSVTIELDLQTTFALDPHAFPERNSAAVIGEVGPGIEPFQDTFDWLPGPLAGALFRGLYADIVQLRRSGSHRGGLCSGMARWAGLRALAGDTEMPERDEALRQITTLHGRQLTDRALLKSFGWFVKASPRAAYRAIRDDSLATGQTLRALDVGVPKPWRRDLAKAIIREGHTIVPFAIRQPSPTRAYVDCYDPNRGRETHTIQFHLDTNRYSYRNKVSIDDGNVGLIAVPHEAYSRKGSAILATLGSMFWVMLGPGRRRQQS